MKKIINIIEKIIYTIADKFINVVIPFVLGFFVLIILLFIFAFVISRFVDNTLYCEKDIIQRDLKTVIRNGGDLDDVKNVYNKRVLSPSDTGNCYNEDVPLSEILSDLRMNYFLRIKSDIENDSIALVDTLYLSLLNNIIDENNKKNPFEKLEQNQRDNFINIQQKLDSGYVKVSGDISKIVDEMDDRNQLVTKYLDKSDTSYSISVIALCLTFIFSGYQIFQSWRSSNQLKKHLDEIEKKINDKE